jgi:hypothetical protein
MQSLKSILRVRKQQKHDTKNDSFEQLIETIDSQIKDLVSAIEIMHAQFQTDLVPAIFNNYLFFRLAFKDIFSTVCQLLKSQQERDRNLIARSLATHLHEFLSDTQDFLGPKTKGGLVDFDNLSNQDLLIKDLYKLKEIYRAIKNKTFKSLSDIRNNTAAHKDPNSLLLNRKIQNIKTEEVQLYSILCSVLFMIIVHFQNNVLASIIQQMNAGTGTMIPVTPYRTVEQKFTEVCMIMQGVEPWIAELASKLTQEEMKKLNEIVAYLQEKR